MPGPRRRHWPCARRGDVALWGSLSGDPMCLPSEDAPLPALLCTAQPRRWHTGASHGPGKALVFPQGSRSDARGRTGTGLAVPATLSTVLRQRLAAALLGRCRCPAALSSLWVLETSGLLHRSSHREWAHPAHPRSLDPAEPQGSSLQHPWRSPLPSPAFHQMLGPEDEMALPTPVPAASLSGSCSGGWIRPRRLNKALPLSGSPRRASPYLAQPPCQEQAGGRRQCRASEGEAVNSSPAPAPKPPGTPLPLAKPCQHPSSILACSPQPGDHPCIAHCCTPNCPVGHSRTSLAPPIRFSTPGQGGGGSEHPWGAAAGAGAGRGRRPGGSAEPCYLSAELRTQQLTSREQPQLLPRTTLGVCGSV